jgi:hypothetical protein
MKRLYLIECCLILMIGVEAENDTIHNLVPSVNPEDSSMIAHHRITTLAIAGGTISVATLAGFYHFKHHDKLQPHFQMDFFKTDWRRGMDATHHLLIGYYSVRIGYDLLKQAGINETQATWIAGCSGLILLSSQELLDGFSTEWKSSGSDAAANILGSALFISQQLTWHNQNLVLKWSYHPTSFSKDYPDALGCNFAKAMIKDYNGQTFWLSANLKGLAGKSAKIPPWINVAVGIGITGVTGNNNPSESDNGAIIPSSNSRRLFYIAPDIDLTRIHTHSSLLKWIFEAIGFVKFPLPALEFSSNRLKFHPLFF